MTERLVKLLEHAPELRERAAALAKAGSAPRSDATRDAGLPLGHHVGILAMDVLATGLEHLFVWQQLLTEAKLQPNTAHMTLLRGALEGVARARWLTEEEAGSIFRVRRGIALLVEDHRNRREFESDFEVPTERLESPAKSGGARYLELIAERDLAGIKAERVPPMTELFARYIGQDPGPGRGTYRLLSAYAHGMQWKGLTSQIEKIEGGPDVPGGLLVRTSANVAGAVMFTSVAVHGCLLAVEQLERYQGRRPRQ